MKLLGRIVATLFAIGATLILGAAGAGLYFWNTTTMDTTGQVAFDRPLKIPPLAQSTVSDDGTSVRPGYAAGYQRSRARSGHGNLGRERRLPRSDLRADRGENVRVNVTNDVGETSTLHWHGMHLPAAMDGGPHQTVEPGTTWSPHWTIDQPASTLWYHPHLHGSTASHVYRGLAGMFLVDEQDGPALPGEYGVDDIPVIVQDKKFDGNQLDEDGAIFANVGTLGDEILVNGTPGPFFLDVTTERVRLRLLNASNARIYNFSFDTGLPFRLIGTDGGSWRHLSRSAASNSPPANERRSSSRHRQAPGTCSAALRPICAPISGRPASRAATTASTFSNCALRPPWKRTNRSRTD